MSMLVTEYMEVNGVKFPKAFTQFMGPQSFDIIFDSIKINEGIEDSKFEI